MDFGSALAEFADLLVVGSQALTRIAQNAGAANVKETSYLGEIQSIAERLREIGEELRTSDSERC